MKLSIITIKITTTYTLRTPLYKIDLTLRDHGRAQPPWILSNRGRVSSGKGEVYVVVILIVMMRVSTCLATEILQIAKKNSVPPCASSF